MGKKILNTTFYPEQKERDWQWAIVKIQMAKLGSYLTDYNKN